MGDDNDNAPSERYRIYQTDSSGSPGSFKHSDVNSLDDLSCLKKEMMEETNEIKEDSSEGEWSVLAQPTKDVWKSVLDDWTAASG